MIQKEPDGRENLERLPAKAIQQLSIENDLLEWENIHNENSKKTTDISKIQLVLILVCDTGNNYGVGSCCPDGCL